MGFMVAKVTSWRVSLWQHQQAVPPSRTFFMATSTGCSSVTYFLCSNINRLFLRHVLSLWQHQQAVPPSRTFFVATSTGCSSVTYFLCGNINRLFLRHVLSTSDSNSFFSLVKDRQWISLTNKTRIYGAWSEMGWRFLVIVKQREEKNALI